MAFLENPRFPDDIAYGVRFGPEFSTSISTTISGREARNRNRQRALCVGDCSHGLKTKEQFKVLLSFFRSMGGRFHGFRFKDWSDFNCSRNEGILQVVSEQANTFQMFKIYQAAIDFNELRKISKPVTGTVSVFRNRLGVVTEITDDVTIDFTTGVITIPDHLEDDTYTWGGEFDVPCRFDTDVMNASIEDVEAYSWGSIPIKEILL